MDHSVDRLGTGGVEPPTPDRAILDLLPHAVVVADAEVRAVAVNRTWRAWTGQRDASWRGHGWLDVLTPENRDLAVGSITAAASGGATYEADWVVTSGPRAGQLLHVHAAPGLAGGRVERIVVTVVDVTAERALVDRLRELATHDSLTGLFNRAQFLEFVGHALDRRRRSKGRIAAVLFVDVDRLKSTNDTLGHEAGDRLLTEVAARIRATVRPSDIVARYGGDEFTVLCEDLRDPTEAVTIADRITHSMVAPNGDLACSVSIGVAFADDPELDPATLVSRADRAMYRAKARH